MNNLSQMPRNANIQMVLPDNIFFRYSNFNICVLNKFALHTCGISLFFFPLFNFSKYLIFLAHICLIWYNGRIGIYKTATCQF